MTITARIARNFTSDKARLAFQQEEKKLLDAVVRVKNLIESKYLPILRKDYPTSWPYKWDFNLLHDLEYRLEARLKDLQSEFYDWHYDTFGWNAYL